MSACLSGLGHAHHLQTRGLGFAHRFAVRGQSNQHAHTGIAQVERVGMALASIADNGNCFAFEVLQISVFFVIAIWHLDSLRTPQRDANVRESNSTHILRPRWGCVFF